MLYKNKFRIESTRLKKWDYANDGAYFVTICVKDRKELLGEILDGKLKENGLTKIVQNCWEDLPHHYPNCVLDAFVIMPNHVHGLIIIDNARVDPNSHSNVEAGLKPVCTCADPIANSNMETGLKPVSTAADLSNKTKKYSLCEMVRGFKTFSSRRINEMNQTQGQPFWQSRFYDHSIRDPISLNEKRQYIQNNPLN